MGNYLNDYRAAIGLYNNVKISVTGFSLGFRPLSLLCFVFTFLYLVLVLSGDIELNPGPVKLKSLSLCHVNIRGLSSAKLGALQTTLCEKYDIITLSETFLGVKNINDFSLLGYHDLLRRDRPTFGGGLGMYIRDNIAYKRHYDLDCNATENMWIEVTTCEEKLLIRNSVSSS